MKIRQFVQLLYTILSLLVMMALAGCSSTLIGAMQGTPPIPQQGVSPLSSTPQPDLSPLVNLNPPPQCPPTATAQPGAKIVPTCPPVDGQAPCAKIPTPLPYKGVCIGAPLPAILAGTKSIRLPVGLFGTALSGNSLVGAAKESGQIKLYAVDLNNGQIRQIGTSDPGIAEMQVAGQYVVWNQGGTNNVFAYDLQKGQEIRIARGAYPGVSGSIVVWVDWRDVDQGDPANIYGYDLALGKEFSVVTRPGKQVSPKIADQWVAYLEIAGNEDYRLRAHHIQTGEDFEVGAVPVFVPPSDLVAAGYFAISDNRLAWVPAQDLGAVHIYDLTTRKERVLPNPVLGFSHPMLLALDSDILVYWDEQWIGYDLSRDVAFSIPQFPSDEWRGEGNTPPLLSESRVVWVLGSDLFTAQIVRNQ